MEFKLNVPISGSGREGVDLLTVTLEQRGLFGVGRKNYNEFRRSACQPASSEAAVGLRKMA